jgi:aflatoxin B1 aldehyde reductase
MYRDRYFKPEIFNCLQLIEPVAEKHGLTLLEIALRWCVHHSRLEVKEGGGRDGVIIGVSSLAQLRGNLADLEKGPLPEEVLHALDKAWAISKASTPSYWR